MALKEEADEEFTLAIEENKLVIIVRCSTIVH